MVEKTWVIRRSYIALLSMEQIRFVLFGFVKEPASHLGRSPLTHSNGYGPSGDRPTCLAGSPTKSESFVQYAG